MKKYLILFLLVVSCSKSSDSESVKVNSFSLNETEFQISKVYMTNPYFSDPEGRKHYSYFDLIIVSDNSVNVSDKSNLSGIGTVLKLTNIKPQLNITGFLEEDIFQVMDQSDSNNQNYVFNHNSSNRGVFSILQLFRDYDFNDNSGYNLRSSEGDIGSLELSKSENNSYRIKLNFNNSTGENITVNYDGEVSEIVYFK